MGYAVDDTVDLPSGYLPGQIAHHDQWHWRHPYRGYARRHDGRLPVWSVAGYK
jgi:hypothetical protein